MKFSEWLTARFWEWEKASGRRQNMRGFANYLGVKYTALTNWMNGSVLPTRDSVDKIAIMLGSEVYEILEIKPDELTLLIRDIRAVINTSADGEREEYLQEGRQLIQDWKRRSKNKK